MAQGDHLYVPSRKYPFSHAGIDSGENTVIHYAGNTEADAVVSEIPMNLFSKGQPVAVRQYNFPTFPPEYVVTSARSWIGARPGYSKWDTNCEHLSTFWKTGRWESRQVQIVKGLLVLAAGVALYRFSQGRRLRRLFGASRLNRSGRRRKHRTMQKRRGRWRVLGSHKPRRRRRQW